MTIYQQSMYVQSYTRSGLSVLKISTRSVSWCIRWCAWSWCWCADSLPSWWSLWRSLWSSGALSLSLVPGQTGQMTSTNTTTTIGRPTPTWTSVSTPPWWLPSSSSYSKSQWRSPSSASVLGAVEPHQSKTRLTNHSLKQGDNDMMTTLCQVLSF